MLEYIINPTAIYDTETIWTDEGGWVLMAEICTVYGADIIDAYKNAKLSAHMHKGTLVLEAPQTYKGEIVNCTAYIRKR